MRVILKSEVPNLGEAGDIVAVSPGYGRNFLIPNGLAIPANEGNKAELEHQKRVAEAIRRKQVVAAQELKDRLENMAVSIRREAGEDDKLFGSVTNRDIAEALAEEGLELDRRMIIVEEPIRSIGLFTVPIKLHRGVEASVRVYVIRAT